MVQYSSDLLKLFKNKFENCQMLIYACQTLKPVTITCNAMKIVYRLHKSKQFIYKLQFVQFGENICMQMLILIGISWLHSPQMIPSLSNYYKWWINI